MHTSIMAALYYTLSSPTVTDSGDSLPYTSLEAEAPTSRTGIPASSKMAALYMSYALSIAHFLPFTFIFFRCGIRTRIAFWGRGALLYGEGWSLNSVLSLKIRSSQHLLAEKNDGDDDHGRSGEATDKLSGGGVGLYNDL